MLLVVLLGHSLFCAAVSAHSFPMALGGRVLYGLGQGITVVAQGKIIGTHFEDNELTFAIGLAEACHQLAIFLARSSVVPLARLLDRLVPRNRPPGVASRMSALYRTHAPALLSRTAMLQLYGSERRSARCHCWPV